MSHHLQTNNISLRLLGGKRSAMLICKWKLNWWIGEKIETVTWCMVQVTVMYWSGRIMYWTMKRTKVTDTMPLDVWVIRLHRYCMIDMIHMCTKGQTTEQLILWTWRWIQHYYQKFLVRYPISLNHGNNTKSVQNSGLTFDCTGFNLLWDPYGTGQGKRIV